MPSLPFYPLFNWMSTVKFKIISFYCHLFLLIFPYCLFLLKSQCWDVPYSRLYHFLKAVYINFSHSYYALPFKEFLDSRNPLQQKEIHSNISSLKNVSNAYWSLLRCQYMWLLMSEAALTWSYWCSKGNNNSPFLNS